MINRLKQKFLVEPPETAEISIKDCVHYCGFKYGGQQYNPYETFISRYHSQPHLLEEIKQQFIEFLLYYRPKSYNEAFGLNLSKTHPLWLFPWGAADNNNVTNWVNDPDDIVDIITHFCEKGIPSYKIDQEFYWLTRALRQIKLTGYQPETHSYVRVAKYENENKKAAYLLLDGNHRLSALHALGQTSVNVKFYKSSVIRKKEVESWPNVKNGVFNIPDALAIFKAYFDGSTCYKTSTTPTVILDYTNNYKPYV